MILFVHVDEPLVLADEPEALEAVNRALTERISSHGCDTASFLYREEANLSRTEASLTVSVNHENGYGGLAWFADGNTAKRLMETRGEEFADSIWVSMNPTPPEFDPEILSDPWVPTYIHRTSALPIPMLRAALEEFCKAGTGDRPECVNWVEGNFNGTLLNPPIE
ncbi:Imm1 family immunity protein [Streptomyces sp. NPDC096136]|uniref:Imm1 family immunity protein n=1 Tax=Streptomyces sp. NPDC096136 TaxID=3366076 RepID=UPI00382B6A11